MSSPSIVNITSFLKSTLPCKSVLLTSVGILCVAAIISSENVGSNSYWYTKDKDYRTHEIMPEKLGTGIVCSFFAFKWTLY